MLDYVLRATNPLHVITVRYDGDLPVDASRWDDVVRLRIGTVAALPDVGDRPR